MEDLATWRRLHADEILGESPALVRALDIVRRVALCSSSVLLTGETGTGKELFARALHRGSPRARGPFVAVNCAAIPEHLIESELFGHVKGAFTGAVGGRPGRFLAASGGTLFLDEVGELPLAAQAKLLRVLEQRAVCPVGADREVPVDVRIVAATHRDLDAMVAAGSFRADLYFRISVVPVALPPLRERGADVELLAEAAIRRVAQRGGRLVELEPSARAALRAHGWPGNVRELGHVVERAVVLAEGLTLSDRDLALGVAHTRLAVAPAAAAAAAVADEPTLDLRTALRDLERRLIVTALARTQGNRTEAAALLGLNRTTLVEKLRRYG